MFEEIPLDSVTREELIESLENFEKTAIPKLLGKKGTEYLKKRYKPLNKEEYLTGLLDAKEKARIRRKKLEEKNSFSKKFINEIRYTFEHIFITINDQLSVYDDESFCKELMKNFKKAKSTYLKLYPDTNFDFDALLKGKTPYGKDYVKM